MPRLPTRPPEGRTAPSPPQSNSHAATSHSRTRTHTRLSRCELKRRQCLRDHSTLSSTRSRSPGAAPWPASPRSPSLTAGERAAAGARAMNERTDPPRLSRERFESFRVYDAADISTREQDFHPFLKARFQALARDRRREKKRPRVDGRSIDRLSLARARASKQGPGRTQGRAGERDSLAQAQEAGGRRTQAERARAGDLPFLFDLFGLDRSSCVT